MATIALDIGGTKIASAIFLSDGSMMFNRKRLLRQNRARSRQTRSRYSGQATHGGT